MNFRIALLVILLLIRFYDLGVRPPHHDEAVNGWFVDGILGRGYYQYDPQNYHGPLYFYFLTVFEKLFGRSIECLRLTSLIFGALVTATPVLFRKWIGERGMWAALFFLAVSPAMVFYSRYAIHEMMFAFASIIYFSYWLRMRSEVFNWKIIFGMGLSLASMACLKENFVLYVGSLIIAEVMTQVADAGFSVKQAWRKVAPKVRSQNFWKGLGAVVAMMFVIVFLVYSAFGRDPNGFANFFKAFIYWTDTGTQGNGHQKPFFYWLNLMTQFEWFALLGLLLSPFALKRVPSEVRLVSVLSVGLWLAYSIVNYKTPWCVLSFYWSLILVTAYWINQWAKNKTRRVWIVVALIFGNLFSLYQSYDAAFANPDQENHLYIYGQTYRDFMVPLNQMLSEAKANPALLQTRRIQVVSSFTWPLPYILGEYKQVGYYGDTNVPPVLDADIIMYDQQFDSRFGSRVKSAADYDRSVVKSRMWANPMVILRKKGL